MPSDTEPGRGFFRPGAILLGCPNPGDAVGATACAAARGAGPRRARRYDRAHARGPAPMISITTKSPYAVAALVELARTGGEAPVPIGELARRREIPVQFLEQLFAVLRRAGVLRSQRGVKGGYRFDRDPSTVTVLEVVELLDGPLGRDAQGVFARRGGRRARRAGRDLDRRRGGARGRAGRRADVLHLIDFALGPGFGGGCAAARAAVGLSGARGRGPAAAARPGRLGLGRALGAEPWRERTTRQSGLWRPDGALGEHAHTDGNPSA